MGATVFANGMSIACKVSSGKTTAAMPDVCLSPPSPPAGPIPIPYPNTASASDTDKGSKTVSIGGEEVMLKDSSEFKTSTGNESATRNFGMGVVTHKIQGVATFVAWSMDVKFEGQNVPRHLDLMGHNEACNAPTATPPWLFLDSTATGKNNPCKDDQEKEADACGSKTGADACNDANCQAAKKCHLVPYGGGGSPNCCDGQTGHHLIEDHWVQGQTGFASAQGSAGHDAAPTVCCEGSRFDRDHGLFHAIQGIHEDSFLRGANQGKTWTYEFGKKAALRAHGIVFLGSECKKECISAQLDHFYGKDSNPSRELKQPSQRQALGKTAGKDRLTRTEAEQVVDMLFGGARL